MLAYRQLGLEPSFTRPRVRANAVTTAELYRVAELLIEADIVGDRAHVRFVVDRMAYSYPTARRRIRAARALIADDPWMREALTARAAARVTADAS